MSWQGQWIDADEPERFRQMWQDCRCLDRRDHITVLRNDLERDVQEDMCARCSFLVERHDEGVLVYGRRPLDMLFGDLELVGRFCEALEEIRQQGGFGDDWQRKRLVTIVRQFSPELRPVTA